MDFQQPQPQPHGYVRPPPPPMAAADPYYHHQQAQRPPVAPPPNPWYSTQFQFHHSPPQPPAPPPLPHAQPPHQPWAPPPPPPPLLQQHSDQFVPPHPAYPMPPPPYAAPHPVPPNQYPHPPPPHLHASLPPWPPHMPVATPHIPQSYPIQVNQEWAPANWSHLQSWDYQANNEEVWAAKARAWAASKAALDNQQQSQHLGYAFKDGSMAGDSTAPFAGGDSSISSSVHQQEVPSSYSSIAEDPTRGIEHVPAVPPDYNFVPPAESTIIYTSVPAMLPAGPQVDPAVTVPSSVPGHSAPVFGRMPGQNFQPTVSSVAASFGIGVGPELHPGAAFPGDSFGVPMASERPKKASVPNWLREEIIKNKNVIVNSSAELPKEGSQSIEEDSGKSYLKSVCSPRSTEDDNDDEDDVEEEAARTAAINQEIKRIVTDVLVKVTDELFDEIATKVLREDDTGEGIKLPTSTLTIVNSDSSATVLLPVKTRESLSYDASEKSDGSPGDVLGLASYASDDDNGESEGSGKPSFKEKNSMQQSAASKSSKNLHGFDISGSKEEKKEHRDKLVSDLGSSNQNVPVANHNAAVIELKDEGTTNTSNAGTGAAEQEAFNHDVDTSKLKKTLVAKGIEKTEKPVENHLLRKSALDGSVSHGVRDKLDKNDGHDHDRNSTGKNYKAKEFDEDAYEGGEATTNSRHEEKPIKKDRKDDQNDSKERGRGKGIKSTERAKDIDTRKRISPDYVEGRRERLAERRAGDKEKDDGKRDRIKDDKREKHRHETSSESSRHKRRHSSSLSNRDRGHKDGGHASDSSDESSDGSKKKLRSRRQKSPSPLRSRKRHVSRSPHSKHSQRRHSPYSSLENHRGRKSRPRSRSPICRKR